MEWGIDLFYKRKSLSIQHKMMLMFSVVMLITLMTIRFFVVHFFKDSFESYVDEANKVELDHLIRFDLHNLYDQGEWDFELITEIGIDAIRKGIALDVYDHTGQVVWSVFEDEAVLSDETLLEIAHNMQDIDGDWNQTLEEYQIPIYSEDNNPIGYAKVAHYASTYYMDNDMELFDTVNRMIVVIGFVSLGGIVLASGLLSKSISQPMRKVSKMAKKIETGEYKRELSYDSKIIEVDELISSINHLSKALNEQETLRKQLTTDIAHELRTPLTTVKGHLDVIVAGIWEPTPQRLMSINEEVMRLSKLVDELRNLAKYDSEKSNLEYERIELDSFLKSIVYNYQVQALKKGITIMTNLQPMMLEIDRKKFSQVIVNLLSNAIKYTNNGGEVMIESRVDESYNVISIQDSGIGIPESDIPNIFERFYRVDKSRSKETGGIGVGLTIAKSIVESHGGVIEVQSKLHQGTRFVIKLPKC